MTGFTVLFSVNFSHSLNSFPAKLTSVFHLIIGHAPTSTHRVLHGLFLQCTI